jgi:hypothetical protein
VDYADGRMVLTGILRRLGVAMRAGFIRLEMESDRELL